jgi:hypothetical protein
MTCLTEVDRLRGQQLAGFGVDAVAVGVTRP